MSKSIGRPRRAALPGLEFGVSGWGHYCGVHPESRCFRRVAELVERNGNPWAVAWIWECTKLGCRFTRREERWLPPTQQDLRRWDWYKHQPEIGVIPLLDVVVAALKPMVVERGLAENKTHWFNALRMVVPPERWEDLLIGMREATTFEQARQVAARLSRR